MKALINVKLSLTFLWTTESSAELPVLLLLVSVTAVLVDDLNPVVSVACLSMVCLLKIILKDCCWRLV